MHEGILKSPEELDMKKMMMMRKQSASNIFSVSELQTTRIVEVS